MHLLLRFARQLQGFDTIAEHQAVLTRFGEVWFGKFGSRVGQNHIDRINRQVAQGTPSSLYLVSGARGKYEVFVAGITTLQREPPKEQQQMVPAYYADKLQGDHIGLWVKLSSMDAVSTDVLDKLVVISSGQRAAEAIRQSMSGKFLVTV